MRQLAILVLVLLLPLYAHAQPIVLAFDVLEPWKMTDANGKPSGAYVEIAKELARRLDSKVEIVECPLKRCLAFLQSGAADMAVGLRALPDRELYLAFLTSPYRLHAADKVFYVRKGEARRLTQMSDLAKLNLGVRLGSQLDARLHSDSQLKIEAVPDNHVNFQKLMLGRIDAVGIAEDQGEFLVATMGIADRVERAPYREIDPTPRSVAVSRKSWLNAKLPQLETAMQAMRDDGTLRRIYEEQYFRRFHIQASSIRIE